MSHTVEILSVGTELLLGNIANTDAQTLSQGLSELGLNVYYHTVVGDNPQRAREAVAIAKKRADIIITTGGLGPTCDDLTKNVLAEAFGKKLVFDEPSAERIRSYFAKTKRPMTDNNLQQAMLPEGCTVLANDWGTAPGCAFQAEGVHVIMLPGPPSECRPMFQYRAKPYLQSLSEGVIASHTLKLFGIGESAMEAQLRDQMNAMSNPTLAPYAKEGECELRVTAKAPTDAEAQALLKPTVEQVKALFGSKVYGVDVSSLEEVVEGLLREKGMTIGVAESCTGGLMAKRLTDVAGASQVFLGGIVSYTNQVKAGMLHVPQHLLDQFGAVSPEVALAMAEGARKALGCDIALATTGVAGPDKDDWDNEVGTMFVAIATPDGTHVRPLKLGSRPVRARLRTQTAHHAFDLARRYLTGLPYEDGAV
ncbi:competence/damage-inducible protein A [Lawsonibacter sp. OA9]|uniref:Putative competence-damage inducible protein n=1 Tax=Flintibacter hominis TaxID=2763048 RepID=A0A8J6J0I3_9FIRM|nr:MULTISPECIES: competence/damage-inducible protein A [Eubacteriales]MBC5721444.1 competence/damage-inducible protein A [Flintibacter hominis]MBS5590317.1 competence/damage-inducible protein A [Clostridiales bacterium]MCH1980295.1 competence/damage-inducible protein A [Lawsonibacter sp. OA9]